MSRIGTFSREVNNTLEEAREGTDTLAKWENSEGVTVRVTVREYPHTEYTWDEAVRVAEYWVSVEGSEAMDGAGQEAPFEGVHSTISGAKDAARDVMGEITEADQ